MNEQLRAVIAGVIQKGTVLHDVSLMSPADRLEAHEKQMVANLVAAIEPLIEREALDHPEERAFADIEARLNIHADQISTLMQSAAMFDAKSTANINRFKDVNNAIERLEREVFGGLQPRDAKYEYPHLEDGLDKRFDDVVMNHPEVQIDRIRIAAERAISEIVVIAELKAMNLGQNTFRIALEDWREGRSSTEGKATP